MNKRMKKKHAILLCIQNLITVSNNLMDKIEYQQKQIDELRQINSLNDKTVNKLFEQQGLLMTELQEQVKQLQKPWYKRKGR
ncbi:TPA: hypothetical protein U1B39_001426 [Streptococcus suis]|nr:hypothetical protein [Streptococcus suis]